MSATLLPKRDAFAAAIDQTLLSPTAGPREGREWLAANAGKGFAALCVAPFLVPDAARALEGSTTRVCSVCGFPLGFAQTGAKADEARRLVAAGCAEVDMVVHIGALIEGDEGYVTEDIAAVVAAVRSESGGSGLVKVILETGHLPAEAVGPATALAARAGAAFVKTSTGFGPRGASVEDVRAMRAAVGPAVGVKAAGGIRDLPAALSMLSAGADRIGTSAGLLLLEALDSGD
ncbi:MAG: deoxyribose-phosphate aldolase [Coriobacteriia bacterium]